MALENFFEKLNDKRNYKNLSKEQKEKQKAERLDAINMFNQLSDKGKKYCMELLTKSQSDLKKINIELKNDEESVILEKFLNMIREWNYRTKAWLANEISIKYNIKSILLYGVHNIGENLEHDLKTFKNIGHMEYDGKCIVIRELNEETGERSEKRKQEEANRRKESMKKAIEDVVNKIWENFNSLSYQGKAFCMLMLKESSSFLEKSHIIVTNEEGVNPKETDELEKILLDIMLLDKDVKKMLSRLLYLKYGIYVHKKSDYNGPRKLSKKEKKL